MRVIRLLIINLCFLVFAFPASAQWGIMDDEIPGESKGRGRDRDDDDDDEDEEDEDDEGEGEWDDDEEREQQDYEWDTDASSGDDDDDDGYDDDDDRGRKKKKGGLHEGKKENLFYLGARFRWLFVPHWFFGIIGVDVKEKGGVNPLINQVGGGLEFVFRRNRMDVTTALWYAGATWGDKNPSEDDIAPYSIAVKRKDQGDHMWEVWENTSRFLLLTVDLTWSTGFSDWFAITYGFGAGFGYRFGDIIRTEATAESDYYEKCPRSTLDMRDSARLKDDDGCQPTGSKDDPNKGEFEKEETKFKAFPWGNLLVGMRFKPLEHMAIYVDGGVGFGFQLGLRMGYIF